MHLTDLEKQVVLSIYNGEVDSISSFLEQYEDMKEKIWNDGSFSEQFPNENGKAYNLENGTRYFLVKNENKALKEVREFLELVEYLYKGLYIKWTLVKIPDFNMWVFSRRPPNEEYPAFQLYTQIEQFVGFKIQIKPPFRDFINNGFMTNEERRDGETREERKANRSTRIVAVGGLVIALSGLIFNITNAIYQSKTYKRDRTVTIINPKAFRDSISVRILNPILVHDTLIKHDTVLVSNKRK